MAESSEASAGRARGEGQPAALQTPRVRPSCLIARLRLTLFVVMSVLWVSRVWVGRRALAEELREGSWASVELARVEAGSQVGRPAGMGKLNDGSLGRPGRVELLVAVGHKEDV